MIDTILNGLLPVAFVILLGWLAGRMKILKHDDAGVIATLVIRFALPLALFEGAIQTSPDKLRNPALGLTLLMGLMGTYLIALGVGRVLFKHDLRTATMQALVCAFPDMAYFGAPILAAMFGPEGFLAVLVGNLITSMFMLPLTIVLSQTREGEDSGWHRAAAILWHSVTRATLNPIVWIPLLGVAISFSHFELPKPVLASVGLMAKAAGGTSLFALGLMLYGEKIRLNANVVANVAMKNFLQPGLMLGAGLVFGLSGSGAHQAIITGAVPTATAAAMFALKNRTYTADATATILLSTLLGIGTEGLLIAMLSAG